MYYLLTPEGCYYNFSGCGNTMNCNHPVVQQMILTCLRYWVTSYRIDGFRFDLASILGRNEDGSPMEHPPLLKSLATDPLLGNTKLIAEAWDAGGLYQVGNFPAFHRWSEWNGKYRDDMRDYLKGGISRTSAALQRISGSPDIYDPKIRGTHASSTSSPATTASPSTTSMPTTRSTTRQTAGTTPTGQTTTAAGTAARKGIQTTRMSLPCACG